MKKKKQEEEKHLAMAGFLNSQTLSLRAEHSIHKTTHPVKQRARWNQPEHLRGHVLVELVVASPRAEVERESGPDSAGAASALLKVGLAATMKDQLG